MGISRDITKLVQDARVELFILDLNTIGVNEIHYFCNHLDRDGSKIRFEGHEYDPWAMKVTGFEKVSNGTQPRPAMEMADPLGVISALARRHQGLVNAKLTRKRTTEKYLDTRPTADPTQQLRPDVFFVARKVQSGGPTAEFELGSPLDLRGVRVPGRTITQSGCRWEYRNADCGYTGPGGWGELDRPITDPSSNGQDRCGYRLTSCKLRFGATSELPFGAFPGARRI